MAPYDVGSNRPGPDHTVVVGGGVIVRPEMLEATAAGARFAEGLEGRARGGGRRAALRTLRALERLKRGARGGAGCLVVEAQVLQSKAKFEVVRWRHPPTYCIVKRSLTRPTCGEPAAPHIG